MKNYNIWKEILFEDLDGMLKIGQVQDSLCPPAVSAICSNTIPNTRDKKYQKRKNYYRQVAKYNDAHKMDNNHKSENNDVQKKEEYNKQA